MASEPVAAPANIRADARNNHARILAAATVVLNRDGASSTLSSIAEEAGVGIGTLYRHFPNRGRLVEAVYRTRVVSLCDAATELLADSASPHDALRAWVMRFVAMLGDNRDIPEALKPALTDESGFRQETSRLLADTVQSLLDAGRLAGDVRSDVVPIDVLRMVTGIAYVSPQPEDRTRPIDIMMDGLRPAPR